MGHGLSGNVENALFSCGSDRVFHNSGAKPGVAIRWVPMQVPPVEKWIVCEGETHDEAGEKAAREFAKRLREEAQRLEDWADGITARLRARP